MNLLESSEQLVQLTCPIPGCGIRYAMPASVRKKRQVDGESWTCPNGHELVYRENDLKVAKQETERLDRQLNRCSIARDNARSGRARAESRAAGFKATITKWGRRLIRGECPICGAKLHNIISMDDHIRVRHPDFMKRYKR